MQKTNLSFIQNINYLSRNIHLLEEGRELLTPSAVHAIETAIKLPFEDIVADVKKGVTEYGKRKLDIDTNTNAIKSVSHVKYSGVVIGGKESSHSVTYPIAETSRPEDLIEGIKNAITEYNLTAEDYSVAVIEDYGIQLVFAENRWSPKWLIRITDAVEHASDPTFTALGYVDLLVSASTEHEAKANTLESSWYASSSSILMLGQSIHLILAAVRDAEASAIKSHGHSMDAATSAAEAEQSKTEVEGLKAEVEATAAEFIESIRYDVAGNYAVGLVLETSNSVVQMPDGTYWGVKASTELPYTITGNLATDGANMHQIPFAAMKSLEKEITSRQEADINLQAQISGAEPLEASAFSPISWHKQEVQNSVIIPPNQNAWSFGPTMTIAAGQSVTIGENAHWTIANGEMQ